MEPDTKKRKREDEDVAKPSAHTAEPDPLEGFGLKEILEAVYKSQSSRSNAFNVFLASLNHATPQDIRSAKALLRPFLLSTLVARHCVRCHQSYLESENSDDACEVGHISMADVEDEVVYRGSYREQLMEYTCCKEQLTEGEADENAVCFAERHTTNPGEVEYTDEEEYEYGHYEAVFEKNFVRTCRDEGCPGASDDEEESDDQEEGGSDKEVVEISG